MVSWRANPNGEPHEHVATIDGREVLVYADRDGLQWECSLDGDVFPLEASTLGEALREAEALVAED